MKGNNKHLSKNQLQPFVFALTLTSVLSLSAGLIAMHSATAAPSYLAQKVDSETVNSKSDRLPDTVAKAVLSDLSRRQGIPVSKLKITEYSRQSWPNGCLGLAKPDELCTQVLVEGWRVVVFDGSQTWVYRTDGSGRNIRLENPNSTAGLSTAVANAVLQDASQRSLRIVQAERRTWSDTCLGLAPPGVFCAALAIPGWLVTVAVGQQSLVYRTDESGSNVRLDEAASLKPITIPESQLPPPLQAGVIFRAIASGGFAGLTTETSLLKDGRLIRVQDNRDGTTSQTQLSKISPEQVQQFEQLLEQQQFAQFNGLEYPPPKGAADYITITLTSLAGTTRYTDINQDLLPSSLQTVIKGWNQLLY